jgi:hypothetical protein
MHGLTLTGHVRHLCGAAARASSRLAAPRSTPHAQPVGSCPPGARPRPACRHSPSPPPTTAPQDTSPSAAGSGYHCPPCADLVAEERARQQFQEQTQRLQYLRPQPPRTAFEVYLTEMLKCVDPPRLAACCLRAVARAWSGSGARRLRAGCRCAHPPPRPAPSHPLAGSTSSRAAAGWTCHALRLPSTPPGAS